MEYLICPYCENSAFSIRDTEIGKYELKVITCNACNKPIGFFKDWREDFEKIQDELGDLESKIEDLESSIDKIRLNM